ncbi:MAG: aminotransferase class I/II-fold pyridoxal phosphate-dependent enzyme [Sodaliphilus pleomorphus]|uniref:aminotransferase class I/II-fold pyridoxal phosphate-dependent enzyme n=1 Tax=Sodaliphilus pleomorphus TaxID=2606626 RepID=UPI00240A7958|nr:aminotransferase class I/II-fold pyridoxal phosphate-dependent enzyme [Sodaliphilus pleomorphus]MDD6476042.1 aminotransferase class I/II-fold pyridoxal phosphate-dependent enzyme [Sodaliphilus pleomorphus]MDD6686399.1 aminotransferase class I/II-fold pyridoxal phosphate-dependent enzyme [Sodaliphilus pleomorphus]
MQAIILAAGQGKRLGQYTKDNTKCMVKVNGVSLIDRVIKQLVHIHVDRLVLVVGYKAKELKDFIGHRYDGMIKIEYIENPLYDKTNNIYSLALAKDRLCEDDTLLLESDLIFEDSLLKMLVDSPQPNLALVAKYETWMDGTMVCINDKNDIVNFVPKAAFRYEDIDIYYKTVNIYKFGRDFSRHEYVPFLEAYSKVMGDNEYYEQVLRVITLLHSSSLKALPIGDRKWYEIDDVQDLDIASTIFSKGEVKYHEYRKRYGGFWRFPKLLDYCYLVNPFFPTQRMKDELRSNFDTLLSEYPSGMWVNSLLAGKYFGVNQDYIVVGNGAAELIKVVMESHASAKVGVVFPTFDEYPNRLRPEQIVPYVTHNKDFAYTADDLMAYFDDKGIKLLLLINPDNPSGNFIAQRDIMRLAQWCKQKHVNLLVDESFVDFATGHVDNTMLRDEILESFPNMMVMKSISKSYGVPGLRLGVLASSDKALIAKVKKEVPIWNINSFAEFYMQIFGKYESDYRLACDKFREERDRFFNELKTIPYLRVIPSQANFFLCEVVDKYTSAQLTQLLIEHDVLISDCARKRNMAGQNLIRLAVRGSADNDKLIGILQSLA